MAVNSILSPKILNLYGARTWYVPYQSLPYRMDISAFVVMVKIYQFLGFDRQCVTTEYLNTIEFIHSQFIMNNYSVYANQRQQIKQEALKPISVSFNCFRKSALYQTAEPPTDQSTNPCPKLNLYAFLLI